MSIKKVILIICGILILATYLMSSTVIAQEKTTLIKMHTTEVKVIPVDMVKKVVVADPEVADVRVLNDKEVMLSAKNPGSTDLIIWDKVGRASYSVEVIDLEVETSAQQIRQLLLERELKEIIVHPGKDKVFLIGEALDKREADRIEDMISPFPKAVSKVRVKAPRALVQINIEVLEVGRDDVKDLGIKWEGGSLFTGKMADITWTEKDVHRSWLKDMWSDKSPAAFTLGFGDETLLATLKFLITEGKARTLANPNLVTLSGKKARFLVGGEIPILITTEERMEVEWREYGVILEIEPTAVGQAEVKTKINAEVSELDWENAVLDIPAIKSREASTELYLKSGETIILAGLIKNEEGVDVERLPFLSKIPILGELFKSKKFTKGETELVISITPIIVRSGQIVQTEDASSFREKETVSPTSLDSKHLQPEADPPLAETGPVENLVLQSGKIDISDGVKEEKLSFGHASARAAQMDYGQLLLAKIDRALSYYELAKASGWEGEVIVGLHLLPDGSLNEAAITKSSGIKALDQITLAVIEKEAPYPPFPPQMMLDELSIKIPIVYKNSAF